MGLLQPGKSITVNELKKKRGLKRKVGADPSSTSGTATPTPTTAGSGSGASHSKKIRLIPQTQPKLSTRDRERAKVTFGDGTSNRFVSLLNPLVDTSSASPHELQQKKEHQTRCYFCCKDAPTHSCSSVKEQLFNERLLAVCPRLAKESMHEADLVCKLCLDMLVKLEDTFYDMGERRVDPAEEEAVMGAVVDAGMEVEMASAVELDAEAVGEVVTDSAAEQAIDMKATIDKLEADEGKVVLTLLICFKCMVSSSPLSSFCFFRLLCSSYSSSFYFLLF